MPAWRGLVPRGANFKPPKVKGVMSALAGSASLTEENGSTPARMTPVASISRNHYILLGLKGLLVIPVSQHKLKVKLPGGRGKDPSYPTRLFLMSSNACLSIASLIFSSCVKISLLPSAESKTRTCASKLKE